ncbi:S9 family peptidase [Streptosporangium roseum]|uniref:Dipeptidylaminopeptidase/acylaminoacyl-peptidase-like protein n=1 Tax=Streptosporangium roseum (strain ATCC 12428 / DSM 43021 / JCM 3005 / KCTC 9067 / NCIMB 10171 / NRRL 2505 / NI 9100) TaxID=479432 RepID=D2AQR9_STRRD|nr:prolyl oligopeptidase family serine peptidase [Streptosporangium roseum]ACZ86466.1 Dipeptidylaminopeptidase/acylaminoacyl-peptidase -like protein [Streptosporangium roseum DSM 43021]
MTEILGARPHPAVGTGPAAWNCWTPALAPDASAVAFVSDRDGSPRVWIRPLGREAESWPVDTGPEPAADVSWSPDGGRLAVLVVPGGGEHTQVWTVRPDGGDLRPLASPAGGSASFVRWTGRGSILLVAEVSAAGRTEAVLIDAHTGGREVVAAGALMHPVAMSRDQGRMLLRRGPRGVRRMYVADLPAGLPGDLADLPPGLPSGLPGALPPSLPSGLPGGLPPGLRGGAVGGPGGERPLLAGLPGSTDQGALSPDGMTAYLLSDAGRDRAALVAVRGDGEAVVLAERPDAELDRFALSADGRRAVLLWNDRGRSELEVLETGTGTLRPLPPPPAEVVSSVRMSLDGGQAVLAAEGPGHPSHVLLCDLATGGYRQVAGAGPLGAPAGAEPVRFQARDGMELTGWLYRVPGVQAPAPFVVYLHGGPESQARPTFTPLFRDLLAAGIGVFAPNVRGSSGFGRAFRDADNHALRFRAIDDVADCASELVRLGAADPARIACMGRSYGGYLTLAALVTHPGLFRAGVDVCGMADFATFYARTEPWIAAAAVSEYGHPTADRDLLRALSPLHSFDRLSAPLLVVHGARDTNVPVHEAEQVLQAARARGVPCDFLLFEDEGHEIRRSANRVTFVRNVVGWLGRHLTDPAPPRRSA